MKAVRGMTGVKTGFRMHRKGRSWRKFIFALTSAAFMLAAHQSRSSILIAQSLKYAAGQSQSSVLSSTKSLSAGLSPQSSEFAGRTGVIAGTVTVERAGGQETLKAGDPLFIKDRILTGAGSSVEIVLVDRSRVKLAPHSSLEITEYLYNPNEKVRYGLISLAFGKARFTVQDFQEFNDRRFRVLTETAVVWSLDTDFIVTYDPELPRDEICRGGLANALCLENSILVSSLVFQDRPALLTANMISQVCGPNPPAPPRFVTAAELARMLTGLDKIGN
jgi:hypothetical protein